MIAENALSVDILLSLIHPFHAAHSIPSVPTTITPTNISPTELRQKLLARIDLLRSQRNSNHPKSSQEIINNRKMKKMQKKQQPSRQHSAPSIPSIPTNPAENQAQNHIANAIDFNVAMDAPQKNKGPSDPKSLLKKIENKKAKMEKLSSSNPQKAAQISDAIAWSTLNSRAQGITVKDDVTLLKKTVKRIDAKKRKSSKEWKSRLDQQSTAQQQRQKKRQENIRARIDSKISKKSDKKSKVSKKVKSTKRPGFEGGIRKK